MLRHTWLETHRATHDDDDDVADSFDALVAEHRQTSEDNQSLLDRCQTVTMENETLQSTVQSLTAAVEQARVAYESTALSAAQTQAA